MTMATDGKKGNNNDGECATVNNKYNNGNGATSNEVNVDGNCGTGDNDGNDATGDDVVNNGDSVLLKFS